MYLSNVYICNSLGETSTVENNMTQRNKSFHVLFEVCLASFVASDDFQQLEVLNSTLFLLWNIMRTQNLQNMFAYKLH